jgi:hypothetical protein
MTQPPRIWVTAPAAGGRSALARPLVEAFRNLGCEAVDMSLAKIRKTLEPRPATDQAAWQESVRVFWTDFLARPPALLVDLSPLPAGLVPKMRERGTKAVYWLLENPLDPAYSYWKEAAPEYDAVLANTGAPFTGEGTSYLPWGAAVAAPLPTAISTEIILHGSHSAHRESFVSGFLAALEESPTPLRIIGPGWLESVAAHRGRQAGRATIEERWIGTQAAVAVLREKIVLVPLSNPVNMIPPRLWDSLAFGATVVAEEIPLIREHLTPGHDLEIFSSPEEAARIVTLLLAEPERRITLARSGAAQVANGHTLAHRAQAILDRFFK